MTKNKDLIGIACAIVFILLLPLIGMQFSSEVNWGQEDFMVIGTLLVGGGLAYALISRLTHNTARRIAIGITITAIIALIWIELAVGLFTNWGS